MTTPAIDRLLAKVRYDGGCWLFTGALNAYGYGCVRGDDGRTRLAHRTVYEEMVGALGDACLDHMCRNRACCNPLHLEMVSRRENLYRGQIGDRSDFKTHCPHGHELTPGNVRYRRNGARTCRGCDRRYAAARKERR